MPDAIRVAAAIPARGLTVDLAVPEGATLAVVGPNGAGKSSLVQLVSGDLRPTAGRVVVHGQELSGPSGHIPPHRRRFGYVEQRSLLFPHLDVLDNVAFGLRARGVTRGAARARAAEELAAVGCADLGRRLPRTLSGGQAQRVSLARSLAIDPELMLLDEPLAALDATVAPEIRTLLRERLRGITTMLVTHDFLDVVALADRLVELADGRVVAEGTVDDLCQRPTTGFLAGLVGVNLLHGEARADGAIWLDDATAISGIASEPLPPGPARAVFPPSAVSIFREATHGSPRNELRALVAGVEDRMPVQRVTLEVAGQRIAADLTPAAVRELALGPGQQALAVVKATQVTLYTGPPGARAESLI
ncbi:sulfate/molybdate ABC transporter ATP-binding protein [Tessaracoccus sp. G1721]